MLYRFVNILVISICLLTAFGCSKRINNDPVYPDDQGNLKYTIENVRDTVIEQQDEITTTIYIKRISGNRDEDVRLGAIGMPSGMQISFEPQTAKPSFYSVIKIRTHRAAVGTYPILITGKSLKSDSIKLPMNIKVLPYSNAAVIFDTIFTETRNCSGPSGNSTHEVSISPDATVKNRIQIKGFWSGTWTNIVYADLDPATKTLTIPSQIVNSITISGTGTYTENKFDINYTVAALNFTETCSTSISRIQ
jgi:hypothetical protein